MATIIPSNVRPSYKSGYARHAAESANPELWKGLVGAWAPVIGHSGTFIQDLSRRRNRATLTNMPSSSWQISSKGTVLDFAGDNSGDYLQLSRPITLTGDFTLEAWINIDGFYNFSGVFGNTYTSSNYTRWIIDSSGSGALWSDSNASQISLSMLTGRHHYLITRRGSTFMYYRDGVFTNTATKAPVTITVNRLCNYGASGTSADSLDGRLLLFSVRDYAMQNLHELYTDPLAPFRRHHRIQVAAPAAAGGFSPYWASNQTRLLGSGII